LLIMAVRILYVLNDPGGGASQGIYEMLRRGASDRFEPFAVAPPGSPSALARMRPLFTDVRLMPIPWWNVDRAAGALRRSARAVGRWRRGWTQRSSTTAIARAIHDWKIDLVHSGTSLTLAGAQAARAAGVPHVWHVKECVGSIGRVQFAMSDRALVGFMTDLSVKIVAMSECTGAIFRANGNSALEVIPDGVDARAFAVGESRALRARLNLGEDEPLVGMVASLVSTWKEHDVFIHAAGLLARQFPHAHFVLIGAQPNAARWPHDLSWAYFRRLESLARAVVPSGRVHFLDFVPDPPDIMRSLDILVHTCRTEPFGRVAIEAMAAGTPVVGPSTGGIADTVVDGETGILVSPGQPRAFAAAVARLLRDEDLRERMGRAGRRRAHDVFSLEQHARRINDLYDDVLGPVHGTSRVTAC
jgi:glycosyltransferase involved in cell wall biosynthesis